MRRMILSVACAVAVLAAASVASAQWGTISGRVIFDDKAPAAKPILITKDKEYCGKFKLVDETMVVGAKGGLKNVVVFVYEHDGDDVEKIHPDYAATAKEPVEFNNVNCRYEPRVATVRTGQPLVIGNKDTVGHNSNVQFFSNPTINPLIPAGASFEVKFDAEERLPGTASCAIHPWMNAYILVKSHPYMAVTDADGNFTLKNVPSGEITLQFWHEKAGYIDSVKIGGKKDKWKKGRFDVDVKSGATVDLGDIETSDSF
ncbi:MAG: hypothetical protein NXI22_03890 [bacterium]|nr:hypothetical protein [bacterium]